MFHLPDSLAISMAFDVFVLLSATDSEEHLLEAA